MKNSNLTNLLPALALGLGVAIGNGFARFAYALLLPAMKEQLHWVYAEAGWLNTANAIGYIVGAVSGYWLLTKSNPIRLFTTGLWLTVASITFTSISAELWCLSLARIGSGIGAAWIFSCGGALVTQKYQATPNLQGMATGIYFCGGGIGIILSGILVNPLIAALGTSEWQLAWAVLGIASFFLSIWPIRVATSLSSPGSRSPGTSPTWESLIPSLISYFLFACGYIVYMTFIFAWLRVQGVSWVVGTWIWITLGFSVCFSPFVWRIPLTTWNPVMTLSASCITTLAGTLVPIYFESTAALFFSAAVFGLGIFIAPSSVTVLSRKTMEPTQLAKGVTLYTIVFSAGQSFGPVLAGWIADRNDLRSALVFGAAMLAVATPVAMIGMSRVATRISKSVLSPVKS